MNAVTKVTADKRKLLLFAILAAWLIFNGILLVLHESWRDEANVWLIARDLSPAELIRQIKWQGHPCLWYFLVMPFAKAGLPFRTICVISYGVMAAAAAVFVFRAPFSPLTKALCLASPFFSYYYPVIARNYCLIALLLILLAACHSRRDASPLLYGLLLGLLVQADTIAIVTAGMISFMWLFDAVCRSVREKTKHALVQAAKGLWIPAASLAFWAVQFAGIGGSAEYHPNDLGLQELWDQCRYFAGHILTRMTGFDALGDRLLMLLFLVTAVVLSLRIGDLFPALTVAAAFAFETVFSSIIYELHIWHHITLCFVLIWFLWLGCSSRQAPASVLKAKLPRLLAEALLIVLSISMFLRWNAPEETSSLRNAWSGRYSDSVRTAAFIRGHVAPDSRIFVTHVAESTPVQAYLGRAYTFYYAGTLERVSFADYNEQQSAGISYADFLSGMNADPDAPEEIYLLRSASDCLEDVPDGAADDWELLYETEETTARGEEYRLYRLKRDLL
ncbi:MAG: hypothetical protein K6G16_06055 [Lachnospiraceae bacterium]|nr:hypothetical protein [Lachnospiraceae bacterium]